MDDCCTGNSCVIDQLREQQAATLRIVLIANAAMFLIELVAGVISGSVALLADSLDMLGDALVYGFGLYVVARGAVWKARAAIAKSAVMGLFGLFVLGQLIYKLAYPKIPAFDTMGIVGGVALAVNGACFALLWHHRGEDINMQTVWLCSRNDLVANIAVLSAAWAVWAMVSPWPDIVVGALICTLFLRSSFLVARDAQKDLTSHHAQLSIAAGEPQTARRFMD